MISILVGAIALLIIISIVVAVGYGLGSKFSESSYIDEQIMEGIGILVACVMVLAIALIGSYAVGKVLLRYVFHNAL